MILRAFRAARWLVPRLPLWLSYGAAILVADMLWLLNGGARAGIESNQRRALGPDATEAQVALSSRDALRNLAQVYVDEFRTPSLTGHELVAAVHFKGLEHLEAAREAGKGVILTSAHFGAPQLVGQLVAVLGYPTTVVVEHVRPEPLFEYLCELRSTHGLRLVPHDGPLIDLFRTLRRQNGVVGLVVDRNLTGEGQVLDFLHGRTCFVDGPARLALRTGAGIVVATCRRRPGGQYEATVLPPIFLPDSPEDPEAAVRAATVEIAARIEQAIREAPGQWLLSVPMAEVRDSAA